jgi:hypothetical protein
LAVSRQLTYPQTRYRAEALPDLGARVERERLSAPRPTRISYLIGIIATPSSADGRRSTI